MINDRRRFWTTLIFILLLAPAVITLLLTLLTPAPAVHPASAQRDTTNPISAILPPLNQQRPVGVRAKDAPLLAASDGRHLWLVHPFQLQEKENADKLIPVYELLRRTANTGVWARSTHYAAYWRNHPQALAVQPLPQSSSSPGDPFLPGIPYVFNEGGGVDRYTLDTQASVESLPPGQIVKAATGSLQGVFAVTLGPPPSPAVHPGARLHPDPDTTSMMDAFASPATTTRAATSTSPPLRPLATAPASAPATAASAPVPETQPQSPASLNAFWLRDNRWILLPPLGQPFSDPSRVPTPTSHLALIVQEDPPLPTSQPPGTQPAPAQSTQPSHTPTLLALWVDPTRPGDLILRSLSLSATPADLAWSSPTVCPLPEQVPALSRLFAVLLDGNISIFWTVPTGATIDLHGGTLLAQPGQPYTFSAGRIAPMSLGAAGQGVRPEFDVALGVSENSLISIVGTKDGLSSLSFSDRGQPMSGPTPVEPHSLAADVQVGRNIAMILLVLVFALALWQWRQRPATFAIPSGLVPAPLHLRVIAFLIDAAVPFLVVAIAFGEWSNVFGLLTGWLAVSSRPEELLYRPEFLSFLALYMFYCSVGELFFRRSPGKAIVGLQVLMVDGKPPTLAAVLLRNLVRLPEVTIGIILFILISENRQRFGDLLARTIVLSSKPPEVPEKENETSPPSPPPTPPSEPQG